MFHVNNMLSIIYEIGYCLILSALGTAMIDQLRWAAIVAEHAGHVHTAAAFNKMTEQEAAELDDQIRTKKSASGQKIGTPIKNTKACRG